MTVEKRIEDRFPWKNVRQKSSKSSKILELIITKYP